jgi:hypothetical protein
MRPKSQGSMEMSDAEGSCWNFAHCWRALFGLGGAQSSQAEPAAPITRQSKFTCPGTSRAGAEVPRIDAKHLRHSSEREADLAKVIPVALTPQHPAWARFRFSTSPLRVQAVQRSILRLSGSSPVSFSRHDKGPWGRAERRACSGCK